MKYPLFKVRLSPDIAGNLNYIFQKGWIGAGNVVEEFAKVFSNYIGVKKTIMVNSCTSALHLSFQAIAKTHDTVLTPAFTCFATTSAILQAGLKIQWLDVDLKTLNVDLNDLKEKYTNQAISIVHFGGRACEINYDTSIVEDCAHAFGALNQDGTHVGSNPNTFSCYSFQSVKTLTTGDGGALAPPIKYYHVLKNLSWYGMNRNHPRDQDIEESGYKYHMNDIAATMGLSNFELAKESVLAQKHNARFYSNQLSRFNGIHLLPHDRNCSYWLYPIFVENRTDFIKHLASYGIESSPAHYRNDTKTCVQKYKTDLPNTDIVDETMTCLPVGYWINTEAREFIVDVIKKGW